MTLTILTCRKFNEDSGGAKKPAEHAPAFTNGGRLVHVLLTIEDCQPLTDGNGSLPGALSQPSEVGFEFTPPRVASSFFQAG
jgi:hypothetical protein